jgi:hypothetical protein
MRLARGARNAELATEFGISRLQVQGIRMGRAREIARSRNRLSANTPASDQTPTTAVPIDGVVRYLRQQNDVVVSAEDGEFLVNGRFHMALAELVARANRMRARQGKPVFELSASPAIQPERVPSPNSHPLFRSQIAAQPGSD